MNFDLEKSEKKIIYLLNDVIFHEIDSTISTKTTITTVKLSKDKTYLYVYLTFFKISNPQKLIEFYNEKSGFFRSSLAKNLKTRRTPIIKFILDDSQEKSKQIDNILKKVK